MKNFKKVFAATLAGLMLVACGPKKETAEEKAAFYSAYPLEQYKESVDAVMKISDYEKGTSIVVGETKDGMKVTHVMAEGLNFESYTVDGKTYMSYTVVDGENTETHNGWIAEDLSFDGDETEMTTDEESVTEEDIPTFTYVETTEEGYDVCTYDEDDGTTGNAYFDANKPHKLMAVDADNLKIEFVYEGLTLPEELKNSEELSEEDAYGYMFVGLMAAAALFVE